MGRHGRGPVVRPLLTPHSPKLYITRGSRLLDPGRRNPNYDRWQSDVLSEREGPRAWDCAEATIRVAGEQGAFGRCHSRLSNRGRGPSCFLVLRARVPGEALWSASIPTSGVDGAGCPVSTSRGLGRAPGRPGQRGWRFLR